MAITLIQHLIHAETDTLRENSLARARLNSTEFLVGSIAERMHIPHPEKHIGMTIANDYRPPFAAHYSGTNDATNIFRISFPFASLLTTKDVCSLFHGVSPQLSFPMQADPLDYSPQELLNLHHALQNLVGLPNTDLPLENRIGLLIFLTYIQDPVLSEASKIFMIGHEVAHIAFKHLLSARPQFPIDCEKLPILPRKIGTILHCGLAKVWGGAYQKNQCCAREHEEEADRAAAVFCHKMQSISGGLHMFKCVNQIGRALRERQCCYGACFSRGGSFRWDYEHPTSEERFLDLERYSTYDSTRLELIEQGMSRPIRTRTRTPP